MADYWTLNHPLQRVKKLKWWECHQRMIAQRKCLLKCFTHRVGSKILSLFLYLRSEAVDANDATSEAIADWNYWIDMAADVEETFTALADSGYQF